MNIDLKKKPELGQVWTPEDCAIRMATIILENCNCSNTCRILDPAVGPATFPKAFKKLSRTDSIKFSVYDTDERMCQYTECFGIQNNVNVDVYNEDFLLAKVSTKYDAIIMNPPYIRHEQIPTLKKEKYYDEIESAINEKLDRRSNLFILFLFKSMLQLASGGVMCAIVYDAIKHSKYGIKAMQILNKYLDLLCDIAVKAPFGDAMIDAQIICWEKRNITCHDTRPSIAELPKSSNYVALECLLNIVRGTALPYRKVFIANPTDKYYSDAKPIFMKQRDPNLLICEEFDRAYIEASLEVQDWLKDRMQYLELPSRKSFVKPITGEICFNYYLRNHPRHLLNTSNAPISDNYYVSTPVNNFPAEAAWLLLNSDLYLLPIMSCARNQGNGLLKLQSYEYRSAIVPDWRLLSAESIKKLVSTAHEVIKSPISYVDFRNKATVLAREVFHV